MEDNANTYMMYEARDAFTDAVTSMIESVEEYCKSVLEEVDDIDTVRFHRDYSTLILTAPNHIGKTTTIMRIATSKDLIIYKTFNELDKAKQQFQDSGIPKNEWPLMAAATSISGMYGVKFRRIFMDNLHDGELGCIRMSEFFQHGQPVTCIHIRNTVCY